MPDLTFEEWVRFVFDRPEDEPRWYDNFDAYLWEVSSAVKVEYMTALFEDAGGALRPYSDLQVASGLWFLFHCEHLHALEDVSVLRGAPWPVRRRGLRSIYDLFAQCFAPRCPPQLSHLDEATPHSLNGLCYMWWDIYPAIGIAFHAPHHPDSVEEDQVLLGVMERILDLASDACRESALHGLNHWHAYYPDRVRQVIDRFLERERGLRPELRQYALGARLGLLQ